MTTTTSFAMTGSWVELTDGDAAVLVAYAPSVDYDQLLLSVSPTEPTEDADAIVLHAHNPSHLFENLGASDKVWAKGPSNLIVAAVIWDIVSGGAVSVTSALPAGNNNIGDVDVAGGNVAHGAPDSGAPVKVGGKYVLAPTGVDDGDRTDFNTDSMGALRVVLRTPNVDANLRISADNTDGGAASGATSLFETKAKNMVLNGSGTWDRMRGDTNGIWSQGNVAAGVADAGNPVKVGGVNNTTQPTLVTGQRGDLQLDPRGNLKVTLAGVKTINVMRIVSALGSVNANFAASSPANLWRIFGRNNVGTIRYFKFYNKASSPVVGTDVPVMTLPLGPNENFNFEFDPYLFTTGLAYAMTTGAADADTGALTAADVVGVNILWSPATGI